MIKLITKILFLIFIGNFISAQSPILQKEAKSLMLGTNVESLNLFGYLENKFEIQLYLVSNKKEWKGICYFPSSNTKINLEGGIIKGKLLLDELGVDSQNIGLWSIDINSLNYPSIWMNTSRTIKYNLEFKELNKTNKTLDFQDVFIETYSGNLINQDYNITLFNIEKNQLKANIVNQNESQFLTNKVKCKSNDCNEMTIFINNNKKIKKLICSKTKDDKLDVQILNQFKTKFTSTLNRTAVFKSDKIAYINKYYQYNIVYPKFNNTKANATLLKELEKLTNSFKLELDKEVKSKDFVDNRSRLSINCWFDIDFISNEVFSGTFIIQKNYSEKVKSSPITLSLKDGKKIDVYKQFKSDFNSKFFIEQFLKESIKNYKKKNTAYKRNNLKLKNFKYITINKVGIVFSTDFNSIFGIDKIIIPYKEFEENIRKRSIFKKIMLR